MKKIIIKLLLLSGLMFAFAYQSAAQNPNAPQATRRQANQTARIAEGRATGELTRRESRNLRREQKQIRRMKRVAKADGVVTRKEKAILQRKQNQANRNIARKKNNNRDFSGN
jgi:hypothetical protein